MQAYLDFEKPIADLESKIEELRHLSSEGEVNIADEVGKLQDKSSKAADADLCQAFTMAKSTGGTTSKPPSRQGIYRCADL